MALLVFLTRTTGAGFIAANLTPFADKGFVRSRRLYAVTRRGGTLVLAPGPEFKQLALNDLGDDSVFDGTPVVSGGQLLLRSNRFLYCIGK